MRPMPACTAPARSHHMATWTRARGVGNSVHRGGLAWTGSNIRQPNGQGNSPLQHNSCAVTTHITRSWECDEVEEGENAGPAPACRPLRTA